MTKVIAVSSNKGGTGKTTIASNLAGLMAENGYKVLIIDLDGQANLSLSFGKPANSFDHNIHDVLVKELPVASATYNIFENIDIIPSSSEMDNFDFEVLLDNNRFNNYFKLLDNTIQNINGYFDSANEESERKEYGYDYIIIDCPPSLGLVTLNAFSASDYVIIPTQLDVYSINGINSSITAIYNMQMQQNPKLKILGIVPSIVDMRTNLARQMLFSIKEFVDSIGVKLFDTTIPKSVASSSSIAYNSIPISINSSLNNNPASKAFKTLYAEVMGEINDEQKEQ